MGLFGPLLMRLISAEIYLSPSVTFPPDRGLIRIHIEPLPGVLVSVCAPSLIDLSSSILFPWKMVLFDDADRDGEKETGYFPR